MIDSVNICYINLDKDVDRNVEFLNRLEKVGLKEQATRISGINGMYLESQEYRNEVADDLGVDESKLRPEYWLSRKNFISLSRDLNNILPRVGCYLSHLKLLKHAYQSDMNSLLVMEDDAYPLPTVVDTFEYPSDDADIIYLGGTFSHEVPGVNTSKEKFVKIDTNVLKLYGTFAYFIPNREKIKELYTVFKSTFLDGVGKRISTDWRSGNVRLIAQNADRVLVNHYQKNGNCYVINPITISHDDNGKSTIGNKKRYGMKFYYNDIV